MKQLPTFAHEQELWNRGYSFIAGIDEVGRGAFAGPLVTAAVIFPQNCSFTNPLLQEINDSKLLTSKKRTQLVEKIKQAALGYSIAEVPVQYINRYGIGKAAQFGFYKTYQMLHIKPDFCLIDAFWITRLAKRIQKPIVHGDAISISIAAASIIAKVYRDSLMESLHATYPEYGFAQHKGYGTKKHQLSMREFGLSPLHRTSFNLSSYTP